MRSTIFLCLSVATVAVAAGQDHYEIYPDQVERELDSLFHSSPLIYLQIDAYRLTDHDIGRFAKRFDIDYAAVKAIIEIETGKTHSGLYDMGCPLINFDSTLFSKRLARTGVNMSAVRKRYPEVFARPNIQKYGSYQRAQQARLDQARQINDRLAVECTFWGMFQIAGFNWRKCGVDSVEDFVELMGRSERDQLQMFGVFLNSSGMLDYVRNRQWDKFARAYNGPKYKAKGYDKRLLAAYNKFKSVVKSNSD
ncbi:MAG: N-acetylmuramidase family protein [Muribaculaceae bacterium]|nr:N-acetylmuramidase family protein [Muribaculaceae bacterium]